MQRFFRGIRLALDCGHEVVVPTSMYRLAEARAACIAGHYFRAGAWCYSCGGRCMPTKFVETCRLGASQKRAKKARQNQDAY
jgi:hypothetical protein